MYILCFLERCDDEGISVLREVEILRFVLYLMKDDDSLISLWLIGLLIRCLYFCWIYWEIL